VQFGRGEGRKGRLVRSSVDPVGKARRAVDERAHRDQSVVATGQMRAHA
jgi:hypothetical protein